MNQGNPQKTDGKHSRRRNVIIVTMILPAAILLAVFILLPTELFTDNYSFVLTDRDGRLLGASLSGEGSWKFPADGDVPEKFELALLTFEDKRFYEHRGIDLLALARAFRLNITAGEVVSGASTITMQIARLGFGHSNRGIVQKAIEILTALKIEIFKSKKQILREFASNAPMGGNVVGLEAAAWRYFGRNKDTLSWAEASTLAVLPNSPSLIHLSKNRSLLLEKRNRLLRRLHMKGYFDETTLSLALEETLPPAPYPMPRLAPHLHASLLSGRFGALDKNSIQSTIRADWQIRCSEIIAEHLGSLRANGIRNAALIVIDNREGRVMAYVGNHPDPEHTPSGWVDIMHSLRSTGSLLKPFLYAAMIDEGQLIPEQLVPDIPTIYSGFTPENASRGYRGAVPAYMALARSLNIPAIRMLQEYSVDKFCAVLKTLGMTTLFRNAADYGLPLIIGGAEGKLWELTAMYSGLARNALGYENPFRTPIIFETQNQAVFPVQFQIGAAYLTVDALLRVQRPGAGENWEELSSSEKIAWKTGTSQGFRDAWAIGVTRDYTVGVWVGNADGEGRPELGGTAAAAPILFSTFDMLPDSRWFDEPPGLMEIAICSKSGYPPGPSCEKAGTTKIPSAAHLHEPCPYCRIIHLSDDGKYRTTLDLEKTHSIRNVPWFILPPAMEWYYRQWSADYRTLPPLRKEAAEREEPNNFDLIYPRNGVGILIPIDLDGKLGQFVAEAAHRKTGSRIFWHLDEQYLGVTESFHSMGIRTSPGRHTLTLIDENGETEQCTFTILSRR